MTPPSRSGYVLRLLAALALTGCSGHIDDTPPGQKAGSPPLPPGTGMVSLGTGGSGAGGSPDAGGGGSGAAMPPPGPVVGPTAGRRLTKDEYANTISDVFGVVFSSDEIGALPEDQPATSGGFRNDIEGLLPTSVRTDAYETLAALVANRVAWAGQLATYATCTDPTTSCREGFVRSLGRVAYRRPLSDNEARNLTPLFDLATSDVPGFQSGARLVVAAMLQSPHFLYRLERIDNVDPASGKSAPSPFELATRLSYLAWQSAPSAALLDAAQRGELSSDTAYLQSVQRLLTDGPAERGFRGYAEDWLQLYRLDTRTPNDPLGVTSALLAEMKQETLRFVTRIALTEGRDLASLFTDKKTELGPALAQVYGVTAPATGFATFDLASDPNRIGILTQPGFLILRAAPERATIVHRGLMVQRVFLCTEVPAPPANAATKIDSIPANLTDRDRFALHANSPSCQACHSTFDPLGYPFEPYDLAGKFRTQDSYGDVLRSDGEVDLDGATQAYANTAEFADRLGKSASVRRCLMSKAVQYALGRSLTSADDAAVDGLAQRFDAAGRTYAAAVTLVATSPAFRASAPID